MPDSIVIRRESPDQPEVVALLAELDSYLARLYEPEANHIGYASRSVFGGYPDNGLSLFYGKTL
jgi:hypothetical protein